MIQSCLCVPAMPQGPCPVWFAEVTDPAVTPELARPGGGVCAREETPTLSHPAQSSRTRLREGGLPGGRLEISLNRGGALCHPRRLPDASPAVQGRPSHRQDLFVFALSSVYFWHARLPRVRKADFFKTQVIQLCMAGPPLRPPPRGPAGGALSRASTKARRCVGCWEKCVPAARGARRRERSSQGCALCVFVHVQQDAAGQVSAGGI